MAPPDYQDDSAAPGGNLDAKWLFGCCQLRRGLGSAGSVGAILYGRSLGLLLPEAESIR